MDKLKMAIIGYGRSGRNIHTKILKMLPELYEITAYVESETERQEMIKKEMDKPVYSDYTALFGKSGIDLVINASFSQDHVRISKELLKNGFNVISEKPVAKDDVELQSILDTAKESGKKFYAFQQYRFSPGFKKMMEVINSGVLGRIISVNIREDRFARRWDWQTVHENTAGVLLNNGPHYVDFALTFMGFPKDVKVKAVMDRANYAGNAEDYAKLILTAPGAPLVDLELTASNAFPSKPFLIQGTRGSLTGDPVSLNWKYFKPEEIEPLKLDTRPIRDEKGEPIYCREKLPIHEGSWEGSDDFTERGLEYYRALHASYTGGTDFYIKHEELLLQMKVMGEAHRQNRELFL